MKIGSFRFTFVRGLAFFLANFANFGLAGGIEKSSVCMRLSDQNGL
jgi:hypothetical protein